MLKAIDHLARIGIYNVATQAGTAVQMHELITVLSNISRDLTFPQNRKVALDHALALAQGAMKSAHNSALTNKFALAKSLRSAAAQALAGGVMVSPPDMLIRHGGETDMVIVTVILAGPSRGHEAI